MPSKAKIRRLALTPGEPAGIGPDLCVLAAQRPQTAELVVLCDPDLVAERARMLGLPLRLERFEPERPPSVAPPGTLRVDACAALSEKTTPGELNPGNSGYVIATLKAGCSGCLSGRWDALVTGPVHKGVINDAGMAFSGHTEFLAQQCAATETDSAPSSRQPSAPVMLLVAPGLRVALATTHLALAEVPQAITAPRLEHIIRMLVAGLQESFRLARPRILVCGLNPHAGEGGHLGREEQEVILPLIERLRTEGFDLAGPLPADTAFVPHQLENADAVLAMYHDQGLPVLKHLGFGRAVNVTLGLPIVRTSVDHGTALDRAGSGRADPGSLEAAIALATEIVDARAQPR